MNEDDSARREFVFGLFLITVITPLAAGLTAFAAALGAVRAAAGLSRLRDGRHHTTPATPTAVSPHLTAPRPRRPLGQRHARRALSTRRPGGVLH